MTVRHTIAPTASVREEGGWEFECAAEVINKRLGRERGNCTELARPHDYQWLRRRTKLKAWWKTCGPIRRRKQKPDTCDNTPPDLLISQLNFSFGVLRKSKAISERVGCCYIPSANRHSPTHTRRHTQTHTHGRHTYTGNTHTYTNNTQITKQTHPTRTCTHVNTHFHRHTPIPSLLYSHKICQRGISTINYTHTRASLKNNVDFLILKHTAINQQAPPPGALNERLRPTTH